MGSWQRGTCPTGVIVLEGSFPRGSCPQGSCPIGVVAPGVVVLESMKHMPRVSRPNDTIIRCMHV